MTDQPSALLIRFPGTNCDAETARALSDTGFAPRVVPVSIVTPDDIFGSKIVVFSGGFSYGDYVMSGRIAQLVAERKIPGVMQEFIKGGGHALGIKKLGHPFAIINVHLAAVIFNCVGFG